MGICTSRPHQGFNISCKSPNGKVLVHFGFRSKVLPGCLTDSMYKVLHWNTMLLDILYTKNSNIIPGITVCIDHASRPPQRIKIQLKAINCLLQVILIYILTYNYQFCFCHYIKKKIRIQQSERNVFL